MRLGRSRPIPALLLRRAVPEPPVSATASLDLVASATPVAPATATAALVIDAGSVTAAAQASATASLAIASVSVSAKAQVSVTASLSIAVFHVALPWPEDFSSGDWSRWAASPALVSGTVANALTVSAGAGVLATSNPGTDGGVRAYPAGALGLVSSTTH